MKVISNAENYTISTKQAQYFAIQVFSEIKQYLAEHKAEFEEWLIEEEKAQTKAQ